MMYSSILCYLLHQNLNKLKLCKRNIQISTVLKCSIDSNSKELVKYDTFENVSNKNKETYLDMVKIFINRSVCRRGHVEFINSALQHMENFGVHKDLEVYKSLINVLPKGKFIPTNVIQAEFMHYPKQQQCAIDLLQQMEDNAVMPDLEMEDMLMNIFGKRGYALRKYWRMMYWMPKFKNLSPWPLPTIIPNDSLELAKLAISRISSVDSRSQITVYKTKDIKDSVDDTWIVSSQSPKQRELLKNHDLSTPVYVEGPLKIWIKDTHVNYFILRTDPPKFIPLQEIDDDVSNINFSIFNMPTTKISLSVHEQEDGTILAICATGTSSKDSLLSWIRHLENNQNPNLGKSVIVFTLKSSSEDEVSISVTINK